MKLTPEFEAQAVKIISELGELLKSQWRKGEFKLEKTQSGEWELTICDVSGNQTETFRTLIVVRDHVVATANIWIVEKLLREEDLPKLKDLITQCEGLDFPQPKSRSKPKTEKGITPQGIYSAANQKGFQIWREGGKTFVVYPNGGTPYKFNKTLLDTAKQVGIITPQEHSERYKEDYRYGRES